MCVVHLNYYCHILIAVGTLTNAHRHIWAQPGYTRIRLPVGIPCDLEAMTPPGMGDTDPLPASV